MSLQPIKVCDVQGCDKKAMNTPCANCGKDYCEGHGIQLYYAHSAILSGGAAEVLPAQNPRVELKRAFKQKQLGCANCITEAQFAKLILQSNELGDVDAGVASIIATLRTKAVG